MSTRPKLLMVYGTSYGQTAKIADKLREELERAGVDVSLFKGDEFPRDVDPETFDAIVVGASVVLGGYQRYVRKWVGTHVELLNRLPSAFFSVCGAAGSENPEEREAGRKIMEKYLTEVGWQPNERAVFAGSIAYTKYNPLVRWVMKRISAKEGGSTDTSRDHEYTDWAQVDAFAEALAALVPVRAESHA